MHILKRNKLMRKNENIKNLSAAIRDIDYGKNNFSQNL